MLFIVLAVMSVLAIVFAINVVLGANYMYLNAKPAGPTILDLMGDWPVYVFLTIVIVIAIWAALTLLFSRRRQT